MDEDKAARTLEYIIPIEGKTFELSNLNPGYLPDDKYESARECLVRACHDIYIDYTLGGKRGLLMIIRDAEPAKGMLWPIGGGMKRGMHTEESLKLLTKKECNLDLSKIEELGGARIFCATNLYANNIVGADEWGVNFYAQGHGKLTLDNLHKEPRVVTPEEFYNGLKEQLHPYVQHFMAKAFEAYKRNK
ncbi:hypothetical protein JXB28_01720 [Candidatus Woesearchaeota archaeon]|nr:hypothetical protein [Candidatus Woesearchaeota archaeon]